MSKPLKVVLGPGAAGDPENPALTAAEYAARQADAASAPTKGADDE